jgi:hypothetical protein
MFHNHLLLASGAFSPLALFASGEQGVWYDPSDFSTMFQDDAGTTPVTAVEQNVGLLLDKSKSGVGTNGVKRVNLLTSSQTFDDENWTKGNTTVSANAGTAPDGTTTADLFYPSSSGNLRWIYQGASGLTSNIYTRSVYAKASGKTVFYLDMGGGGDQLVFFDLDAGTVGDVATGYTAAIADVGSGWYRCSARNNSNETVSFNGLYGVADANGSFAVTANGTDGILLWGAQIETGATLSTYQPITASWLSTMPGNHAYQSSSGSRPVLRARYNLLTYSEQFDNAAWATYTGLTPSATNVADPIGGSTADVYTWTSGDANRYIFQEVTVQNATYNFSVWLRSQSGTVDVVLSRRDFSTTVLEEVVTATTTWQRFSFSSPFTIAGTGVFGFDQRAAGTQNGTVEIWGADLRITNDGVDIPAYQRIAAATDYDTVGFLPYLAFDGSDDFLVTGSINPGSVDKAQVFAGVRRIGSEGMIAETSVSSPSAAGSFYFYYSGANVEGYSRGAAAPTAGQAATVSASMSSGTEVYTITHDIAGDLSVLRRNAVAGTNGTDDKGAGNFTSQILYVGRRGGSSLAFGGRLYGLIVRFSAANLDAGVIDSAEAWMAAKTGVTL